MFAGVGQGRVELQPVVGGVGVAAQIGDDLHVLDADPGPAAEPDVAAQPQPADDVLGAEGEEQPAGALSRSQGIGGKGFDAPDLDPHLVASGMNRPGDVQVVGQQRHQIAAGG